jgi:hypothetical protein
MNVVLETRLARFKLIEKIVQSRQDPCKSFKDAVMWKYEFIGVIGQSNDRRHHQLSKIFKGHDCFVPYLASDPLSFHDYGDPYDMSIDTQASVLRSFLSSGPNLQVEVRAPTFVPGGPYPKMHLFWKIPSNLLDDELQRNNTLVEVEIARQLPFFESRQALAEIRNLLGPLAPCPSLKSFSISKSANIQAKKKKQLSNLSNMIMNHARDKDEQNVHPQCHIMAIKIITIYDNRGSY